MDKVLTPEIEKEYPIDPEEELMQDEEYVNLLVDMAELQDELESGENSDLDDEIVLLNSLGF